MPFGKFKGADPALDLRAVSRPYIGVVPRDRGRLRRDQGGR